MGEDGGIGDHDHSHDGHEHGHGHGRGRGHGHGGWLRSVLRPHSHDAADSVDAALTASSDGMRALGLSLVGLGVTAAIQLVVVLVSGSVALLSDTIHNFADALTAVPLGLAFVLGRRPPNERYNYGYGRSEDLAGIFIVATIAASSGFAAFEAITRFVHPHRVHQVGWVVVAGLVGFAGNETVAAYRVRVGRRIGSAALVADGMHARADGLTSLAVVVGAIGVAAGWQPADAVAGLAITATILLVVKNAARDVYRRLMDAVDPALVTRTREVVAAVPGVEAVEAVRIRWVGHELRAEVEVDSDAALTISAGHAIAEEVRHKLLHDVPRLTEATIHTSPHGHDGQDHHAATAHHFPRRDGRGR